MARETSAHPRFRAGSRSYAYGATQALVVAAVTASTASADLIPKGEYRVVASTACWIKEAASPTAVADTAGNVYLPANVPELIQFPGTTKLAAIRVAADGYVSLTKVD